MRNTDDISPSYNRLLLAGGSSGLISFIFKCVPDLVFINQINNSLTGQKKSSTSVQQFWHTSKGAIYWDFKYRMLMGFATFPFQRVTERNLLNHYGNDQLTLYQKAMIGSFSGWLAAMVEISIAHPLDSMRATVKSNPQLFKPHFGIPYFLQHQSQLRIGMGAGFLRNTFSNPPAWCAKTLTQERLSNTALDENLQNAITSMTFAFTRFMTGYPLDVIKTAVQCDATQAGFQSQYRHSWYEKTHYALNLTRQQIKKEGLSFLTTGLSMRLAVSLLSASAQMYLFNYMLGAKPKKAPILSDEPQTAYTASQVTPK